MVNQTILIGSEDAGGAFLTLDGDSNGDGSGGDYCSIGQNTNGNMQISADNPNGDANIIFLAGNSQEKLRIYATMGVKMETNNTVRMSDSASINGVGYGERTRIYPYWVSDRRVDYISMGLLVVWQHIVLDITNYIQFDWFY